MTTKPKALPQDDTSVVTTASASQQQAHTIDDTILVIITLISILITELISCFTPSPKKSPELSVTSPSPKKKVPNSSRQTSPMSPANANVSLRTETLNKTSVARIGATGNPSTTKKTSKVGTKSQATRTSKSGHSTASASPQVMKRSNQTIPTAGLGFSR